MADFDPRWADSIAGIESGGASNPYTSVTPSPGGRQALGKYQVMAENVPEWTQAALGSPLTPQQFLSNPDAQEAVFKHRFGSYVDKYGSPQDAASTWFTGRPINDSSSNAHDSLGTSGADYVRKFNDGLDGPTAIQHAMHIQGGNSPMAFADPNDPNNAGALSTPSTIGPGVLAPGSAANGGGLENGLYGAAAALASIYNPAQGQVLNSMRTAKNGQYTMTTTPDGTLVRINNQTGQVEKLPGNYAKDERKFGIIQDKNGNKTYGWSPTPEQWDATHPNGGAAAPADDGSDLLSGLHGQEFMGQLQKSDPDMVSQTQAVLEGRVPYPTGMFLKTDQGQRLARYVTQADPSFESGNATARTQLRNKFNGGTIGDQITAGNTAIQHAKEMSDSIEAMKDGGNNDSHMGIASYYLNELHNGTLKGTGTPEASAYNDFKTAKNHFAEEVTKFYSGSSGSEAERTRALSNLDEAKSLPELRSAIQKESALMQSKVNALQARWRDGMDPGKLGLVKDFPLIKPESQEAIDSIAKRNGISIHPAGTPAPVAPAQPNTAQTRKTSNGVTWSF